MYYYKARMYSPTLGRFMQTDPIGYADGMNWYDYVKGDPVNNTDPSGLCYGRTDYSNYRANTPGVEGVNSPVDGDVSVCGRRADAMGGASFGGGGGMNLSGEPSESATVTVQAAKRKAKQGVGSGGTQKIDSPCAIGVKCKFPTLPSQCTVANNFCETPEQRRARMRDHQRDLERRQRVANRNLCFAVVGDAMRSSLPWSAGAGGITAVLARLAGEGWGGPVGLIGGFNVSTWAAGAQAYMSSGQCR